MFVLAVKVTISLSRFFCIREADLLPKQFLLLTIHFFLINKAAIHDSTKSFFRNCKIRNFSGICKWKITLLNCFRVSY